MKERKEVQTSGLFFLIVEGVICLLVGVVLTQAKDPVFYELIKNTQNAEILWHWDVPLFENAWH